MEKVLEKSYKRYVLGAIEDGVCYYLKVRHENVPGQLTAHAVYECTVDIEQATKATSRSIIEAVLDTYDRNVGEDALEFVVLPLVVDYSLLKEVEE